MFCSYDEILEIFFPEHFIEEQGRVVSFLLKGTPFICQSLILFSFVSAFFDIDFLSRRTAVMLDAVVISTK